MLLLCPRVAPLFLLALSTSAYAKPDLSKRAVHLPAHSPALLAAVPADPDLPARPLNAATPDGAEKPTGETTQDALPQTPPIVSPAPDLAPGTPAVPTPAEENPNIVLPPVPLPGATPRPEIAPPIEPVGPTPVSPTPEITPIVPGDGEVMRGTEKPTDLFELESPDGVIYDFARGLALAQNKVSFKYGEFLVEGDKGILDNKARRAILTDNLTVTVRGQVFKGKTLTFDLDTGKWILTQLATEFPPEFFPPGTVLSPIYVRDGDVLGDYDSVGGQNFKFTSCDRDHYYLKSKKLEFSRTAGGQPKRIVLRRNALYVLGRRVLPLPVYVVSLLGQSSRSYGLQPTFGQNSIDGYFAKTIYNVRASSRLTDSVLIDVLQKRGLGLGYQREYLAGGILYFYALSGNNGGREINARVDKTYKIASVIDSNIRYEATQNNSLTGEGVAARNGQVTFNRNGLQAQTAATFNFDQSSFGFGQNNNETINLEHRQNFGSGFSLEAQSLLNRTRNEFDNGFGNLNTNENATSDQTVVIGKESGAFDTYLRAELHNDLARGQTYQLERFPELTFQSTTERLALPGLAQYVPGNYTFGVGRFNEPDNAKLSRADFFYTANDKNYRLLGRGISKSSLRSGARFEQAFYSNDTARYNYDFNLGLDNKVGAFSAALNYNKQRTYGFTPFQFDFSTPGEYLDATLSYQPAESLRVNLSGGRDIQNSFTRDLLGSVQYKPSPNYYASLGTTYSPETHEVGDIYGNFRVLRPRQPLGGSLALGIRYSPQTGLSRLNAAVDLKVGNKTRFEAYAGYNGFSSSFDFSQFRVTRDLHCFNLYATYDSQRRELRFDLAIKAFPFADTRFGRNQFSEGFDPSVGGVQ